MSYRFAFVALLAVSAARADTIYVDVNCPGPGNGSVRDPYCSIQTAIDNAVDTDEIVVAPGTYFETINFLGKAITLRSSDGPHVTIIDAGGCFEGRVVTCEGGEGPDTVLEGFTVTGGCDFAGGGMYNVGSSPTVIGCVFSNNYADNGGGIYNENSNPTVIDCIFDGNATFIVGGGGFGGGGMFNFNSSPTVIGCTFRGNIAVLQFVAGGGMFNFNSNPIIMNCLFDANISNTGSGMHNDGSSPTVANCTFSGNFGDVIRNSSSNAVLANCVFWGNDIGGQIVDGPLSSSTVSYSDVQGGWSGAGSNNIDTDPLFASTSNCCVFQFNSGCDDADCAAAVCSIEPFCCDIIWDLTCALLAFDMCSVCPNDNRLQSGSPCIDAADNTAVPADITTDLDGIPRFVDDPDTPDSGNGDPPIVDMGAYEFQGIPCPWDLDGDGNVFVTDLLLLLMDFGSCGGSPADFDGDGCVTVVDLLTLLGNWGPCPGSDCIWDVNGDGTVDQTDLQQVLTNLGPCDGCPEDVNGDGVVNGLDAAAVATHFGPCP